MEEALVAGAAEFHGEVALREDEGAVDEGVEGFEEFEFGATAFFDFFDGEAGEGPDVPAEFFAGPVGDFLAGFGLDEWFPAAEGEAGLAFEGAQPVFDFFDVDEDSAVKIPGFGILAPWAMVRATLCPEDGAEAITIDDAISLDRTREANLHFYSLPVAFFWDFLADSRACFSATE